MPTFELSRRKKKGKKYRVPAPLLPVLLLALAAACGGCSTSPAFQYGVHASVPLVAQRTRDYAAKAVDAPAVAAADRLLAATRDRDRITLQAVSDLWSPVERLYLRYVEQDPVLTPTDRQLRKDTVIKVNGLIAKERARARSGLPLTQRP